MSRSCLKRIPSSGRPSLRVLRLQAVGVHFAPECKGPDEMYGMLRIETCRTPQCRWYEVKLICSECHVRFCPELASPHDVSLCFTCFASQLYGRADPEVHISRVRRHRRYPRRAKSNDMAVCCEPQQEEEECKQERAWW
jgi:hypothetical protein